MKTIDYRWVDPGQVVSRDRHFELLNEKPEGIGLGETDRLMKFLAGRWWEIEEDTWWYFLEVLPPIQFTTTWFAMCEFTTGSVTGGYFKVRKRYFHAFVDLSRHHMMAEAWTHIQKEIAHDNARKPVL